MPVASSPGRREGYASSDATKLEVCIYALAAPIDQAIRLIRIKLAILSTSLDLGRG